MKRTTFYFALLAIASIGAGYAFSNYFNSDPAPPTTQILPVSESFPRTLIGNVIGITDGDTVTVLTGGIERKIRLAGIDAPERNQDFGQKSKQYLSSRIFEKVINVNATKIDKYGRVVGQIFYGDSDVNLEMLNAGLAWHYKKYESEQSETDRKIYAETEVRARKAKKNIWSVPNPAAPWSYRDAGR
jgi:endonuclease YncB( thermonuclease family)